MKKLVPQKAVLIPDQAKRVFSGIIYDVYHWQQPLFDGTSETFEMLKRPDTVTVICIVDDKILVLADEQPHRGLKMSFPGGRMNTDESTEQAVRREIQEETGYIFKHVRLVKVRQPHTKIEWFVYSYVAWEVEDKVEPHLDGGEKISVELLPFEKVKQLVIDDKVGYLAEEAELFENTHSTQELHVMPAYQGREVDR